MALVELLLAAVILALCVVPITGTISFIRTNAVQAKIDSQVYSGMQSILNAQLDAGRLATLINSVAPVTTTQTLAGGITVTYTLTTTAVTGYQKLFALTCTASWTSPSTNRADAATLTTYALTV